MIDRIPESDWRVLRELREIALERFCERVLVKIGKISSDSAKSLHERYLEVYRFIHRRDAELARAFNDPRRSQAVIQLAAMCSHRLLEPEELARFSPETRDRALGVAEIMNKPRRGRKREA